MKDKIKNIDNKYFGSALARMYFYLMRITVTPVPKKFSKIYSLKVRYNFFKRAQYYLQVNRIEGVYAEFGSHEVNTFRMALRTLGLPGMPNKISKFYAFDSFEGMPEPVGIDVQKIWRKSMNFTSEKRFLSIVKRDKSRVVTVKGFYEDTLPKYNFPKNTKIALAYIDCDYYSSTKSVLNFLDDKFQHGCLLVFDDWDCYYSDPMRGQKLAFREFKELTKEKYHYEELCDIESGGRCFVVLENSLLGVDVL
jgi:hypothetical protein